jgi:hypothetical protein
MRATILAAFLLAATPAAAMDPFDLPGVVHGVAGWGRFVTAAPACNMRTADWGNRLRRRLVEALNTRTGEPPRVRRPTKEERDAALQLLAEFEGMGRDEVAHERREACRFLRLGGQMQEADDIVAGVQTPWER